MKCIVTHKFNLFFELILLFKSNQIFKTLKEGYKRKPKWKRPLRRPRHRWEDDHHINGYSNQKSSETVILINGYAEITPL
jgi:hypothetical protein